MELKQSNEYQGDITYQLGKNNGLGINVKTALVGTAVFEPRVSNIPGGTSKAGEKYDAFSITEVTLKDVAVFVGGKDVTVDFEENQKKTQYNNYKFNLGDSGFAKDILRLGNVKDETLIFYMKPFTRKDGVQSHVFACELLSHLKDGQVYLAKRAQSKDDELTLDSVYNVNGVEKKVSEIIPYWSTLLSSTALDALVLPDGVTKEDMN